MYDASQYYVQMDEMMSAVGAEIAQHMGSPYAVVTNGCCAAIALATVACVVGTDPELSASMPYYKVRSQVIVPKYSRNPYDLGIRMSGTEIVEVETEEEMNLKINERTAMIYVLSGPRAFKDPLSLKSVAAIGKARNIPVFVDAAAEEPRFPNIHLEAGATFVAYSGGKCMRGPQAAGVLLGPKDLCAAAFWNAGPHHNWGRGSKVGKEEAMGMLAAVREWFKRDHEAEQKQWADWLGYISDAIKDIPTLTARITPPGDDLSNRSSVLRVQWDATQVGITGTQLGALLDKGTPRIILESVSDGRTLPGAAAPAAAAGAPARSGPPRSSFSICPYMMQPGDYKIVADAVSKHMHNRGHFDAPPVRTGPTAEMEGTWDVTINYLRGIGHQKLMLKQNDKMLTGDQHGEIFGAAIHGSVDANYVMLTSSVKTPGWQVPYTFTGLVNGNKFSGDLNLGEYGAATFTAVKL
jgi:seryl-tRNA(Sec) selenium transferase